MKKNIFPKIVLFIVLSGFLHYSCSKDDSVYETKETNSSQPMTKESYETETKIRRFIDRINIAKEHPTDPLLAEWNYSQEQTLWYLEAAFNYQYCFPHMRHNKIHMYDEMLEIKTSESGCNILDIGQAYYDLYHAIDLKFKALYAHRKYLKAVDIEISETTSGTLLLIAKYYIGKFDVHLPLGPWRVTVHSGIGGICGTQKFASYDGSDKLEQELYGLNDVHQTNGFFTQVSYDSEIPDMNVINPLFAYWPFDISPIYGQHFAYPPYNDYAEVCIPKAHMQEYINNLPQILAYFENKEPTLRIFLEEVNWSFQTVQLGQMPQYEFYYVNFLYGTSHARIHNPIEDFIQ